MNLLSGRRLSGSAFLTVQGDRDPNGIRASRLKLAALTARTLSRGLALLGLTPLERM